MRGMNSDCIDLTYLDPPFNSNRTYSAPIGSKAAGAAFKDAWSLSDLDEAWHNQIADVNLPLYKAIDASGYTHGDGMKSYLIMMAVRLMEMRRLLKPTGSIYLHCDATASHYLKVLMDSIFGGGNFRNEIVWGYTASPSTTRRDFPRKHDTILRYAMSDDWTFNDDDVRIPYAESSINRAKYAANASSVLAGTKSELRPGGKLPPSVWVDVQQAYRYRKERVGYPTQKPLALLERIIRASSNEGDVVLDPFCGCATTCIASERLGREWVGIDLSPLAVQLVERRAIDELGLMGGIQSVSRTDIPSRTDLLPSLSQSKVILYGLQSGNCEGCGQHFLERNLTIDHIIPRSKGGTDHLENLQLLCDACNRLKCNRPMEYLIARLNRYSELNGNGSNQRGLTTRRRDQVMVA